MMSALILSNQIDNISGIIVRLCYGWRPINDMFCYD